MTRYPVYLEIAADGRCMAHVPDLPGCVIRAPSRDEALSCLPEAIRDYHAWLRRHGEAVPPEDEPVEIEVAGESTGFGPFDPGDPAALFAPDQQPVTPEEMEHYFRLMAHARADLLALVRDLPDEVLDWQPDPQSLTIRRLLRHVGNAEKWYVSRLVAPETLPPEWEHDEDLPILEFLEMERRTAMTRLRQLTEEERLGIFYPAHWTQHPEEPWTARKALRRFLEHERRQSVACHGEHTAQVRQILAAWRAHLLAQLAAERAGLLEQIIGLDERTLSESPVFDDWTAKDLLAHVAAWGELVTERIGLILAGREEEITGVDLEARNAALHAERRDWPLERAVEACLRARADFLATLAKLPDEEFHRLRHFPWGGASARLWTQWRALHDAEHAADLAAWRGAQDLKSKTGLRAVMLARLAAKRAGLLTRLVGLDERALTETPVLDSWTAKDLLAHVAAWDRWELREMMRMRAGEAPNLSAVREMDAYNAAVVSAWRERTLAEVLAELREARATWLAWLGALPEEEFFRRRLFDDEDWSFPGCVEVQWRHDAEHAAHIAAWREAEGLKGTTGPKEVLLAALSASRQALLAAAALIPTSERASRSVVGEWTLKDVLGHVADWEWWCVDGLRQMAAGQTPQVEDAADLEAWNRAHAAARRDQPWDAVWRDFNAARQTLLDTLAGLSQADLARPFPAPWGAESTPYEWACIPLDHDLEHTQDLMGDERS